MLKWYLYVTIYYYFDENLEDKEDQNRNILPTKKSFNFIRFGMFRRHQLLEGNDIVNDDVIHSLVHIFLNT